jgi:probable rRNA maturation factor
MTLIVDIQMASASEEAPDPQSIERWVGAAIGNQRESTELSIRIVDVDEGQILNEQFRGSTGATNVLSFPFENESPELLPLIGDIVICAPVVLKEASEQNKTLNAHWAHMIIHGVLHLLGHDHQNENDANLMETLETEIMQGLGFPPPYSCQ